MESLDGPKIKADILQLFRVQQNFVNKDQLIEINENARRLDQEVKDSSYELNNLKERVANNEKTIERNQNELKTECQNCMN